MKITIHKMTSHRNGIDGSLFNVFLFEDSENPGRRKLGILFEAAHHCAILDVTQLAEGDIAFGSNSWRGDQYEPHLRAELEADQLGRDSFFDDGPSYDVLDTIDIVWTIDDVLEVRPDLTHAQASKVLQATKLRHDATIGVNWDVLKFHAQELFGDAPETNSKEA